MDYSQKALTFGDDKRSSRELAVAAGIAPAPKSAGAAKTISDLYLADAEAGVLEAARCQALEELKDRLAAGLPHNSSETRVRSARFVIRWFFPDGIDGIASKAWSAYQDKKILGDVLRYLYLSQEPVMGACVEQCLFPIETGMRLPKAVFDRYLTGYYRELPSKKTSQRLKTNLIKLGFLERLTGDEHRLLPVHPAKTSLLLLAHYLFAPAGARTVELSRLLADPFWKYLGFKREDEVRGVLREADVTGVLGKYVVADRLEQITTRFGIDDFLANKARV
ncbi:MAG TPA: hypothetical protein VF278_03135 [Pirellulales bacterium]